MSRFGPGLKSWFRRETVTHSAGLCHGVVTLWIICLTAVMSFPVLLSEIFCSELLAFTWLSVSKWRSQGAEAWPQSRHTAQTVRLKGLYAALWLNLSFMWWSWVSQSLYTTMWSPSVYHKVSSTLISLVSDFLLFLFYLKKECNRFFFFSLSSSSPFYFHIPLSLRGHPWKQPAFTWAHIYRQDCLKLSQQSKPNPKLWCKI